MRIMNQEKKNVKFNPNLPTEVELTFDEPKTGEGQYGTWYLYGIKETIKGESGFFATQILHELLQGKGVKSGSKLVITKIVKDEKTTWDVQITGGGEPKEVSIDDVPKVIHDLNTEKTLEEKVEILWKAYSKTDPSNPVDDLPF